MKNKQRTKTQRESNLIVDKIHIVDTVIFRFLAFIYSGLRIFINAISLETKFIGTQSKIIHDIHTLRFGIQNKYIITGGHFSDVYLRNCGVFYNSLLDPRIPSSTKDWHNREALALKTIMYHISSLEQIGYVPTTLIRLGKNLYVPVNIYTNASDSLFALLYTLRCLTDEQFIPSLWPSSAKSLHTFSKLNDTRKIILSKKVLIAKAIDDYYTQLIETHTGLIKKSIFLSSARDGIKRESSFYDNVILYATVTMAIQLDCSTFPKKDLARWRNRIITAFWDDKEGFFRDDLSTPSQTIFSADTLIVLSAHFLDVTNPKERIMLIRIVRYIQKNQLDAPFPLHYAIFDSPKKLYWPVKYFAPSYMGKTIWSHWGMEYIKLLLLLSPYEPSLQTKAKQHLASYAENIVTFGGYPELYDLKGKPYKTYFYTSVMKCSWVINYEQACLIASYPSKK